MNLLKQQAGGLFSASADLIYDVSELRMQILIGAVMNHHLLSRGVT